MFETCMDSFDSENDQSFYTNYSGVEMETVTYLEALYTVYNLAQSNQVDDIDQAFTNNLEQMKQRQTIALNTVGKLLEADEFFKNLSVPKEACARMAARERTNKSADIPTNALRIVYSMAEQASIDPQDCARNVELADECDLEQQALEIVNGLIVKFAKKIDALELTKDINICYK